MLLAPPRHACLDASGLVVAAAVAFAFFWIALIPVFGAPLLDTGGESFRCVAKLWRLRSAPIAAHTAPRRSASSSEVATNLYMFKAALRASVSTGKEPDCRDTAFSTIPTIDEDTLALLVSFGAGDCAGLKAMLELAAMNCDTDLVTALASLPAQIAALAGGAAAGNSSVLTPEVLTALLGFEFPSDVSALYQVCPATCGECGDGGSTAGEAGEHALQSQPTNLLQMTFESWEGDPEPPASGGDVLSPKNIKRICDVQDDLLASPNFDKFCFKLGGLPEPRECVVPYSLCPYMSPTTSKVYSISVPAQMPNPTGVGPATIPVAADGMMVRGLAIAQLFDPTSGVTLSGMDMYQIIQYAPPVEINAMMAGMLSSMIPDAKITNSSAGVLTLSGNAKYGACTDWGDAVLSADGSAYTSISFTGCSIPDGNGPLLTNAGAILQIAKNLRDSEDVGAKSYLLTKDFLEGTSDKCSASKMRIFSGIPYDRDTYDTVFSLASKTEAECKAFFDERETKYENCEGAAFWLKQNGAPAKFKSYYDPAFADNAAVNEAASIEWWHMLNCGRVLLSYNAQCVEDLNKKEQQALFDTYADEDLFPLLNDQMVDGAAPYDYSGPDGEFKIYFTEFSRLIQKYFDGKVAGDGAKASIAMLFSYAYIIFHTRDFGLSTVGMIHIMVTVPVALSFYLGPFGFGTFNTLCPLGIFVILGIGADDIFIVIDMWKQSLRYFPAEDLHTRMAWTWARSAHAMLTTTLTTAAAFMANGMSPIPPIAVFGIFTALLVIINYVFCITWFPAMIILKEKGAFGYWIPAYCGCCGACLPISWFMYNKATDGAPITAGTFCGGQDKASGSDDPEMNREGQSMKDKAAALKDKAAAKAQELKDKAVDKVSGADDVKASMTKLELFFFDVFAPAVDQFKIPIIIVFSLLSLVLFIFAVQLAPAEDAAQFLPDSDPMQRNIDLASDPDIGVFTANEQQQFVNLFFGQESIDRSDTDFLNMADYGVLQTASAFETTIATSAAQEKFMTVCDRLRDENDPTQAGTFVRRVDNTDGEVYCVFEDFRRWVEEDKGLHYPTAFTTDCVSPCVPLEKFRYLISEFSNFLRLKGLPSLGKTSYIESFGNTYADTLRFDFRESSKVPCGDRRLPDETGLLCRPLIMVQLYFNVTFKFNSVK